MITLRRISLRNSYDNNNRKIRISVLMERPHIAAAHPRVTPKESLDDIYKGSNKVPAPQ